VLQTRVVQQTVVVKDQGSSVLKQTPFPTPKPSSSSQNGIFIIIVCVVFAFLGSIGVVNRRKLRKIIRWIIKQEQQSSKAFKQGQGQSAAARETQAPSVRAGGQIPPVVLTKRPNIPHLAKDEVLGIVHRNPGLKKKRSAAKFRSATSVKTLLRVFSQEKRDNISRNSRNVHQLSSSPSPRLEKQISLNPLSLDAKTMSILDSGQIHDDPIHRSMERVLDKKFSTHGSPDEDLPMPPSNPAEDPNGLANLKEEESQGEEDKERIKPNTSNLQLASQDAKRANL